MEQKVLEKNKTALDAGYRTMVFCKDCKHEGKLHDKLGRCLAEKCKCNRLEAYDVIYKNKQCRKCDKKISYDVKYKEYRCVCGNRWK